MRTFLAAVAASVLVLTGISAADAATSPYKVSIRLNHTQSTAGAFIVVSGHVTGSKANGSSVTIQRRYVGESWKTVAKDQISSNDYSARVETPRGGSTSFRVLKGRSSTHSAAISSTRTIKVYEWLYLANESGFLASGHVFSPMELDIDGTLYRRSIQVQGGSAAALVWKLSGQCTTFTTVADFNYGGADPDLDADVMINRAQVEGSDPATATTTLQPDAAPSTISSSLSATKFFQLATSDPLTGTIALGNPRVRCNLDHLPSFASGDF